MEPIVVNIEKYCASNGETIKTFEKKCKLANGTFARWKKGLARPTLRTLEKIQSGTNISIGDWLKKPEDVEE